MGDAGALMALLPDLRRLCIGTRCASCARTGEPPCPGTPVAPDVPQSASWLLPHEIFELIVWHAAHNTEFIKTGASEIDPNDLLKLYDEMCREDDSGLSVLNFRCKKLSLISHAVNEALKRKLRPGGCRNALMSIFRAYGWTDPKAGWDVVRERIPDKYSDIIAALETIRTSYKEEERVDALNKLTLKQLRLFAGMHAALHPFEM